MNTVQHVPNVRNLLEITPPTPAVTLAKPWHYRRNGRYHLRLRTKERPFGTFTVSLRTANRATAMETSRTIQRAIAYFQLGNPEASWEELRARLIVIAEECLATAYHEDGAALVQSEGYRDMYSALRQLSSRGDLSLSQHRALILGQSIMGAANARLEGNSAPLVGIVDQLSNEATPQGHRTSVGPHSEPLSWSSLRTDYLEEHRANLKESSVVSLGRDFDSIERTLVEIGITDLRAHTRSQLIAFRTALAATRKPSTVNKILTQFRAVLQWAVRNDKMPKHYADDIKFKKGAESSRKPFTRDQVVALMAHVEALPGGSWERWALSLLVVTGARVGEVAGLLGGDVREVDGFWCIDINEDVEGKSIKNSHSKRLVPLVDGALGFDLKAFLEAVDAGKALPSAWGLNAQRVTNRLGELLRKTMGGSREQNQSLHSLRHHMASAMKAAGVEVQYAQSVTGHASRTITYDTYGKGGISVAHKHEAIRKALTEVSQ